MPPGTKAEPSNRKKAGTSSQKLILFIRGKAMSGAPIISGTNQLPKPPIIAGMTMKKTMIRPWAEISTFHRCVGLVGGRAGAGQPLEKLYARLGQLEPHHAGDGAADDPGDDREDQIEGADVLVVGRHEPAHEEAGLVIGVMMVRMGVMLFEMHGVGSRVGHVSFRVLYWWRPGSSRAVWRCRESRPAGPGWSRSRPKRRRSEPPADW